jgi:dynein heavy chain
LPQILAYKETGTYIMKAAEEISQLLDDHIVMTQAMSFSPYKKPFENRIMNWESKLRMTQDVMEEWATCQRAWLYLEPIFSSEDINRYVLTFDEICSEVELTFRNIQFFAEG